MQNYDCSEHQFEKNQSTILFFVCFTFEGRKYKKDFSLQGTKTSAEIKFERGTWIQIWGYDLFISSQAIPTEVNWNFTYTHTY